MCEVKDARCQDRQTVKRVLETQTLCQVTVLPTENVLSAHFMHIQRAVIVLAPASLIFSDELVTVVWFVLQSLFVIAILSEHRHMAEVMKVDFVLDFLLCENKLVSVAVEEGADEVFIAMGYALELPFSTLSLRNFNTQVPAFVNHKIVLTKSHI